ncbi:MAG: NAD(P)H-binding protein [Candidatus Zixiibacteriota bacterium]|nr:MAG: NAD(P)H-binding protein [candidate division Zixibacteria bacterium]
MPSKVLVIGGTGMLGLPVAERLKLDGFEVTIMSSNVERAKGMLGDRFDIVEGDVTRVESLKAPMDGKDFVYINLNSELDPNKYQSIEVEGTAYVAAVAFATGIKRIVMITGASSKGEIGGVVYLDAKVKAERAVIASTVPYTIMRPSWFFESLPKFIQKGRAAILGEQPIKRNWLAVSDYARQVSVAFQKDEAANKCFYNLGPKKLTMMEALTKFCGRHYPDLKPETVSFGKAKFLSHLPGMKDLRKAIPFFEYFNTNEEDVDPTEANRILGANTTTLETWIDSWQKPPDK